MHYHTIKINHQPDATIFQFTILMFILTFILQRAAHKLNQIITEYGLTIFVQKTKSMAFTGRDPVRTKIVIDNKIIKQVNSFNYLGNMISYEKELDIRIM